MYVVDGITGAYVGTEWDVLVKCYNDFVSSFQGVIFSCFYHEPIDDLLSVLFNYWWLFACVLASVLIKQTNCVL